MAASWEGIQESARILLVDDDSVNLRLFQRMFLKAGYQNIKLLSDPRSVRERVATSEPDLILLDLTMPHLDGYQVLEEIKDVVPEATYLPIVVVTGRVDNATMLRALLAGAKDFQPKPVDFVELMLRARILLETRFRIVALQREVERLRSGVGS